VNRGLCIGLGVRERRKGGQRVCSVQRTLPIDGVTRRWAGLPLRARQAVSVHLGAFVGVARSDVAE
jgi:hypothetical protein